jgi:hypothetical protein
MASFEDEVSTFCISELTQPVYDGIGRCPARLSVKVGEGKAAEANRLPCRLRARGERRGEEAARDQRHEGASLDRLIAVHAGRLVVRRHEVKGAQGRVCAGA